jgi:hypothetical protein
MHSLTKKHNFLLFKFTVFLTFAEFLKNLKIEKKICFSLKLFFLTLNYIYFYYILFKKVIHYSSDYFRFKREENEVFQEIIH